MPICQFTKRAYPKFNRVEEAFSATIEEHDKIPVHVVADWSSQPGMVVLNGDRPTTV